MSNMQHVILCKECFRMTHSTIHRVRPFPIFLSRAEPAAMELAANMDLHCPSFQFPNDTHVTNIIYNIMYVCVCTSNVWISCIMVRYDT